MWITQFYLQVTHHTCLYRVVRQREPRLNEQFTSWWSLLFINRPREDERLSWPCWLSYSGRFTHINGYPSAAGPVQTSESSPVRDQRFTTEPPNQPYWTNALCSMDQNCSNVVNVFIPTSFTHLVMLTWKTVTIEGGTRCLWFCTVRLLSGVEGLLHTMTSLKPGFHYPSSRAELTAHELGCIFLTPKLTGVKKWTRVHGPSTPVHVLAPINSGR